MVIVVLDSKFSVVVNVVVLLFNFFQTSKLLSTTTKSSITAASQTCVDHAFSILIFVEGRIRRSHENGTGHC